MQLVSEKNMVEKIWANKKFPVFSVFTILARNKFPIRINFGCIKSFGGASRTLIKTENLFTNINNFYQSP